MLCWCEGQWKVGASNQHPKRQPSEPPSDILPFVHHTSELDSCIPGLIHLPLLISAQAFCFASVSSCVSTLPQVPSTQRLQRVTLGLLCSWKNCPALTHLVAVPHIGWVWYIIPSPAIKTPPEMYRFPAKPGRPWQLVGTMDYSWSSTIRIIHQYCWVLVVDPILILNGWFHSSIIILRYCCQLSSPCDGAPMRRTLTPRSDRGSQVALPVAPTLHQALRIQHRAFRVAGARGVAPASNHGEQCSEMVGDGLWWWALLYMIASIMVVYHSLSFVDY